MALADVIGEVRSDGERRAQALLDAAQAEADAALKAAQEQVAEYSARRKAQAERDAAQAKAQILSGAEFEARKLVLSAESTLREELRAKLIEDFAGLPKKTREAHIKKLLAQAKQTLGKGTAWCAKSDLSVLQAQKTFAVGGETDIAGGIVVESADGTQRLDLSYETLLADMWRDILRSETALFD